MGNTPYKGLSGQRSVLTCGQEGFPQALSVIAAPPKELFVIGNIDALQEGIAIVGARKATPYGKGLAQRFARHAALRGIVVISGGARGCDSAAHRATVEANGQGVVFLGGGADVLYPPEHAQLFQRIIDSGGAIVSEYAWNKPALPYQFRLRNRLIAGLAKATLIVEAGLPSGTFSTADEALASNREVLVVPGCITAPSSKGANRLIYQGATPVIDDETFDDALFSLFCTLKQQKIPQSRKADTTGDDKRKELDAIGKALSVEVLSVEQLLQIACRTQEVSKAQSWLMKRLVEGECAGEFSRHPDGRWGPVG